MPPAYAGYQSAITAYQVQVRALRPQAGQVQPLRLAYHLNKLHYIRPEFVSGQASQDLVIRFCDMEQPVDILVGNNFAVEELPEEEWPVVWEGLPLALKIRWFEFKAAVETATTQSRQITYLYCAIAAICKAGTATQQWCETRTRQMAELHGIALEKSPFTPAILNVVFREFVVKTNISTESIYNMLLAWNAVAESRGVTVLMWAIQQMAGTGAATALMIADVTTGLGIRYEVLRQAGVPEAEVEAFVTAALDVIWDRLSYVVRPTVDSGKYAQLSVLCRGADEAAGGAYENLQTSRVGDQLLTAKQKMMLAATRASTKTRTLLRV